MNSPTRERGLPGSPWKLGPRWNSALPDAAHFRGNSSPKGLLATILAMFCLFCLTAVAANPVLVGTWPGVPRGDALAVAVSGAHAYVAAGDGGVLVIDISNPAAPAQVGGYLISGEALAVAVSGNYAYVVADIGGLLIINVSNPTAPALAGTYLTDADPLGVAVSGKRAYVTYENRLEVVDVTNPATPLQTARPCFSPRPGF